MFVTCGIWCLADVSSVSPSSEQTVWHIPQATYHTISYHINLVDQTHVLESMSVNIKIRGRVVRSVVNFFTFCLNKPYGKLFSKNALKVSAALWFCQNRGKFEIRHSRCRGNRYLTEIGAFSLRSYRKTRSNLHICFGHIINHLSTFLKLDIVSTNM